MRNKIRRSAIFRAMVLIYLELSGNDEHVDDIYEAV